MNNSNTSRPGELSYFCLSLLSYLKDAHPDKADDQKFIAARGDSAAEAYSAAIKQGLTYPEAGEIANEILFEGLYFSLFNTLVNIIWDEFSMEIPPEDAHSIALQLLPTAKVLQAKYPISDDFAATHWYELLYTELTGTVQLYLEEDGIQ